MLKKLEINSVAKLQARLMSLIGLLCGFIYSIAGLFIDLQQDNLSYGTLLAFLAIIGMPILFGFFGYITGLIGASLNNVIVKIFK